MDCWFYRIVDQHNGLFVRTTITQQGGSSSSPFYYSSWFISGNKNKAGNHRSDLCIIITNNQPNISKHLNITQTKEVGIIFHYNRLITWKQRDLHQIHSLNYCVVQPAFLFSRKGKRLTRLSWLPKYTVGAELE